MQWYLDGDYGKGDGTQYIPGWNGKGSSWGKPAKGVGKNGKGTRKGKGKGDYNHNFPKYQDKDYQTLEDLHAQLALSEQKCKEVLNTSKQLRAQLDAKNKGSTNGGSAETQVEESIACPTCGTLHNNMSKLRCRMKNCRAILQPDKDPAAQLALTTGKSKPKDPLHSNFMQALFARHHATELLVDKDLDKKKEEDNEGDVEMAADDCQDTHRAKMESILQSLRDAKAPSETIKAQEKVVAALPKPKPGKPLMDAGAFTQALSQAKEHHNKVAEVDDLNVEACQRAITKAQENMEQAVQTQKENKAQAQKTFATLRGLIAKAQEESQETFLPVPASSSSQQPAKTHPDHDLLLHDLLNTISPVIKSSPHLQEFLKHVNIVPKDPNGALPSAAQLKPTPADAAEQAGESKGGKGSGTKESPMEDGK